MRKSPIGNRRIKELMVLWSLVLSAALMLAAGAWSSISYRPALIGVLSAGGLTFAVAALFAGRKLDLFKAVLKKGRDAREQHLRRWTRLQITSMLLFLLGLVGLLTLMAALAVRIGLLTAPATLAVQMHFVWALTAALALTVVAATFMSLRVPVERRADRPMLFAALAAAVGLPMVSLGAYLWSTGAELGSLHREDGAFLQLAGVVHLTAMVFPLRGLPTPYAVLKHDPSHIRGPVHYTRDKGVLLPVFVATGLLVLLMFLFAIFGLGLLESVERVAESIWVTLLLAMLFVAMIASFVAGIMLARKEDRPVLYGQVRDDKERKEEWILGASLGGGLLFGAGGLLVALGAVPSLGLAGHRWVDLTVVGLLVSIGPIGFYKAYRMRRIRRMEDRFPDFLRDIASSNKGGLTLASSVHVAAKGDYGDLTPEIRKMSDQLSWNVGFEEVFARFGKAVRTPVVQRTVSLILEASRSGGSTVDVLHAASRDAREIKGLENQRRLNMILYLSVIYVTFFVFLGVIAMLYTRFMPEIIDAAESTSSSGSTGVAGLNLQSPSLTQYRTLYYLATVVQAVGNGVIAGLMMTGRALHGMRHAFVMVLLAFGTFSLVLW